MTNITASLDALEALLAKATPGEWNVALDCGATSWPCVYDCKGNKLAMVLNDDPEANSHLIVALRNTAPDLIAKARRVKELEAALRDLLDLDQRSGWHSKQADAARAALKENTDATGD